MLYRLFILLSLRLNVLRPSVYHLNVYTQSQIFTLIIIGYVNIYTTEGSSQKIQIFLRNCFLS